MILILLESIPKIIVWRPKETQPTPYTHDTRHLSLYGMHGYLDQLAFAHFNG
jgi:hypothetical protein